MDRIGFGTPVIGGAVPGECDYAGPSLVGVSHSLAQELEKLVVATRSRQPDLYAQPALDANQPGAARCPADALRSAMAIGCPGVNNETRWPFVCDAPRVVMLGGAPQRHIAQG